MTRDHDPSHEQVLVALLTEGGDRAALLGRIEGCAVCEEKLRELDVVADLISASSGAQEPLATDALPPFEPGEEAGAQRLRELAAGEFARAQRDTPAADGPRPAERPRPPALLFVALAAAAAILLYVVPRLGDDGTGVRPPDDIFIGEGAIELLSPDLAVGRDAFVVTWTGELQDVGDAYLLRIQEVTGRDLPDTPVQLTETTWTPTPEQIAAWPDVVRIQVSRIDYVGDDHDHTEWREVELTP